MTTNKIVNINSFCRVVDITFTLLFRLQVLIKWQIKQLSISDLSRMHSIPFVLLILTWHALDKSKAREVLFWPIQGLIKSRVAKNQFTSSDRKPFYKKSFSCLAVSSNPDPTVAANKVMFMPIFFSRLQQAKNEEDRKWKMEQVCGKTNVALHTLNVVM